MAKQRSASNLLQQRERHNKRAVAIQKKVLANDPRPGKAPTKRDLDFLVLFRRKYFGY